ncbi:MAG TPA: hypothetical protein V6D22_17580 [Candidatus Obscuribacterales bacterium]
MESWTPAGVAGESDNSVPKLSLIELSNPAELKLVRLSQLGSTIVSDAAPAKMPAESVEAKTQHLPKIPRLDGFNSKVPVDRFREVADGVTASSRIRRESDGKDTLNNYRTLLEKMHPSPLFSSPIASQAQVEAAIKKAAKDTAIVDLRTRGDNTLDSKAVVANDNEMLSEQQASRTLGIAYHNRPMISKVAEAPKDLKETVDLVHKEVTAGKEVDIHCYHGTDRTGLVVESYKATYDPRLSDLVKNHGRQGVDAAYAELGKDLLQNGVDPATHAAVFQSLHQYLQFLHDGQNANAAIPVTQIAIANDAAQQNALRSADAKLGAPGAATLDNYRDVLSSNFDKFDPSTHNAFYRQMDKDFSRNYRAQH